MPKIYFRLYRVLTVILLAFISVQTGWAQTTPATGILRVEGEVEHPLTLHQSDLDSMERVTIRAMDHDQKEHEFSGVSISDILIKAGAALGGQLRGKNMTKFLLVTSRDGYQTVFALAELDAGFTDRRIILADHVDGLPVPADKGPFRIIVPGEKKYARWNWGVTTFTVKSAAAGPMK